MDLTTQPTSVSDTPADTRPAPGADEPVTLTRFLTDIPPGRSIKVLVDWEQVAGMSSALAASVPPLMLHCDHSDCGGPRRFEPRGGIQVRRDAPSSDVYLTVTCGNCKSSTKTFALHIGPARWTDTATRIEKYGEKPAFGKPAPAKLLTLLGSERSLFLKGRRAEQQAMGIAAFAYYRRVVDNKRVQLFERIIAVAKTVGADPALIDDLEAAKAESQFTEAVKKIKHALPEALLIKGQDPLTLLYGALSEGLHNRSDAECLEDAAAVRQVLTGFVERLSTALEEDREMSAAVKRLAERRGKR